MMLWSYCVWLGALQLSQVGDQLAIQASSPAVAAEMRAAVMQGGILAYPYEGRAVKPRPPPSLIASLILETVRLHVLPVWEKYAEGQAQGRWDNMESLRDGGEHTWRSVRCILPRIYPLERLVTFTRASFWRDHPISMTGRDADRHGDALPEREEDGGEDEDEEEEKKEDEEAADTRKRSGRGRGLNPRRKGGSPLSGI